jgi:hypothetical protein
MAATPAMPMATRRFMLQLLIFVPLTSNHGLRMDASRQKHQNEHNCRGCQRQIHEFRCYVGKNITFDHHRLLKNCRTGMTLLYMGQRNRIYEAAIEVYFRCRPLGTPLSSSDRRSLWRLGRSTDQCIEVKMPVFFLCTDKPSSADISPVV